MPRIPVANDPAPEAQAMLDDVKKKLGGTPNVFTTMAHAPAVFKAYLEMSGALGEGRLDAPVREQIALAIAGTNRCDYCAAAHTAIGKGAGLSEDDIGAALRGHATDGKAAAAVTLATRIMETRGDVADEDLQQARDAGWTDADILEITANVALNALTNFINKVADPDVDFPRVDLPKGP